MSRRWCRGSGTDHSSPLLPRAGTYNPGAAGYRFLDLKGIAVSFQPDFQGKFVLRNPGLLDSKSKTNSSETCVKPNLSQKYTTETTVVFIQNLDDIRDRHGAERFPL